MRSSWLASEFLGWAQAQGAQVRMGKALHMGRQLPYQPFIALLRHELEQEQAPGELVSDVWLTELARLLPELRERSLDLLAAWAIITGILELIAPLSFPMSVGRGVVTLLVGVVSVVFGVLIATRPASGLLAVVWLIGIYAIVVGILYLVEYFESRSLASRLT